MNGLISTLLLLLFLLQVNSEEPKQPKVALILTLAGSQKLVDYFEWTCRTIYYSRDMFDLLVFHENNQRLRNASCAENVKFFNLGERGISTLLASKILEDGEATKEDTAKELTFVINNILVHSPKYLVEIKPLFGDLFSSYIGSYSHWSYTDPDIIWGNLPAWISKDDLEEFDILSIGKNWDAARLYLRGQFTIHKNTNQTNYLWKKLPYFQPTSYAKRMGTAYRMLSDKVPTDMVFRKNFQSAEGWYSHLVFQQTHLKMKIVGRGFDDFFREPVILYEGILTRCALSNNLSYCITQTMTQPYNRTISDLPTPQWTAIQPYSDAKNCKMYWLPVETRQCLAAPVYDKKAAARIPADQQTDGKLLLRIGEVKLDQGQWYVNDEMNATRQVHETAAYFHFRDWDRYITQKKTTLWSKPANDHGISCMVLYLRIDKVLAFEDCEAVKKREALTGSHSILLEKTNTLFEGHKVEAVSKVLSYYRKEAEVGEGSGNSNNKGNGEQGHHAHQPSSSQQQQQQQPHHHRQKKLRSKD